MDYRSPVFSGRVSEATKTSNESSLVYMYLLAGIALLVSVSVFLPRVAGG